MRLHGNAELSLNNRRRLARRVDEDGWALTRAAQAAEVSVRTARKWVRRHRAEPASGSASARAWGGNRSFAMSARAPASSFISTSRSSDVSRAALVTV